MGSFIAQGNSLILFISTSIGSMKNLLTLIWERVVYAGASFFLPHLMAQLSQMPLVIFLLFFLATVMVIFFGFFLQRTYRKLRNYFSTGKSASKQASSFFPLAKKENQKKRLARQTKKELLFIDKRFPAIAVVAVLLTAMFAYNWPERYQLANLIPSQTLQRSVSNPTNSTQVAGEADSSSEKETLSTQTKTILEKHPNLYALLAPTETSTQNLKLGGMLLTRHGELFIASGTVVSDSIQRHGVRSINLGTNSVTSRVIKNGTISSEDLASTLKIGRLKLGRALATDEGGTGLSSYTPGDLLYYSSGSALSRLALGAVNQILKSNEAGLFWSDEISYTASGNLLQLANQNFSLKEGTLDDGKICTYSVTTGLECTTTAGSVGVNYWTMSSNNLYPNNLTDNLALGATNAGSAKLYVNGNVGVGTTNPFTALEVAGNAQILDNISDSNTHQTGLYVTHTASNSAYGYAIGGEAYTGLTGDKVDLWGQWLYAENDSSGNLNRAVGLFIYGTGNQGGGTITNNIGLYIEDQTVGATNFAIKTGLGKVSFGDNVGIGTTTPGAKLEVNGNISIPGGTNALLIDNGTNYGFNLSGNGLKMGSLGNVMWTLGTDGNAVDTNLSRGAAGKVYVGNGTQGDYSGTLIAGNVGIGTTNPGYKLEVNGLTAADGIRTNIGLDFYQVPDPVAPSGTPILTSGNLNSGTYYYVVMYYTDLGQTHISNGSAAVMTDGTHQQVTVAIPVSTDSRVIGRKIYRTLVNDAGGWSNARYLATIYNNTATTYVDNIADGGLGAEGTMPYWASNTTSKQLTVNGNNAVFVDNQGTYVGYLSGQALSGAPQPTLFGSQAGMSITKGGFNTLIGAAAGHFITTGMNNTALGRNALYNIDTSSYNTAVGWNGLELLTSGDSNTVLGNAAGNRLTTGSNNIFLGNQAGVRQTSVSNLLIIDNQDRGSAASEATNALIYGNFASTPANQKLTINGNVGIGTINPGSKLVIIGSGIGGAALPSGQIDIKVDNYEAGVAHDSSLVLAGSSASYATYSRILNTNNGNYSSLQLQTRAAFTTVWQTGLTVDAQNGNVGIGTTAPQGKLEVAVSSTAGLYITKRSVNDSPMFTSYGTDGHLYFSSASGQNIFTSPGANASLQVENNGAGYSQLRFYGSTDNRIITNTGNLTITPATGANTIFSQGNVGIGTTAPAYPLDVVGNIHASNNFYVDNYIESATSNLDLRGRTGAYGVRINYGQATGGFHVFDGGTNERFTVLSTGNVGIGTTNPGLALDVVGNARFSAIGSGAYTGAVNRMADGTLTTATSDVRFKKDITTIDNPLDKVLALRGVTFNWKDPNNPKRMLGMIAQEVLPIVPELVFQSSDGYYGINYGETSGLLIEAIKQQQGEITGITNNQNQIVAKLTGQLADQNLSVDNKLQLIGASLNELTTEQIAKLKDQVAQSGINIDQNTSDIQKLKDQYTTIQDQYLTLSEILLVSDGVYDFKKGVLKSSGVVAGAFAVKVEAGKPQTIGAAYICPTDSTDEKCADQDVSALDGKSVIVNTKAGTLSAVTATAKIFTNFENNPKSFSWTEKDVATGKFTIMLDKAVTEPIKVNWWIVEEK